jgi:hypothetical protein
MSNAEIIYPDKWGPHVWQALHYITLGYPQNPTKEQKLKYKTFFVLLKDTLPCSVCAHHYSENLKKMPLSDKDLTNKESLVKWLINFHNIVNEMKEKPVIKYIEARRMIDTNTQCVQPVKTIEKFTDVPKDKSNNVHKDNSSKSESTSCLSDNNLMYILVAIFIGLIFIAVVYKKK